jgi:glycosyltransferase involved in cell wall biosynthesis
MFQFGGSRLHASLVTGLARHGHPVRLLTTRPPDLTGIEPGDLPGVDVDWFVLDQTLVFPQPPTLEEIRVRRERFEPVLDRALAERRPDVVLFGTKAQPLYAAEVCRERGLPTIAVSHGVPTAGLLEGVYPERDVEVLLEALAQVDLVVTVAHHLETVLRTLGLSNVRTIQTGADTDAFRPRPKNPDLLAAYDIEPGDFVVGSFSALIPGKGMDDFVASAEIVLREEPRAVYLLAGGGPLRNGLLAAIDEKGLGERFRVVGELYHPQVPEHMALCDAIVLASVREGCPLICLESQASGVAMIAGEIPATRELVEDGVTGILFPVGNVEALAAATLRVAHDPGLLRALGVNARARAEAHSFERWLRTFSAEIAAVAGLAAPV